MHNELKVRYRDTDLDGYGPNGHPCLHGALIDLAPFDGSFACDCSNTGFDGANCANDSRADRKSESTDGAGSSTADLSTAIVVIVLSIIILLVGGGAALHSYKARKDRLQPVDFEEVHDRMLGSGELTPQQLNKARDTLALSEDETHVPREIKRSALTLVSKLGNGEFGEVWRGLLDESKSGGVPAFMVAIKTCKVRGTVANGSQEDEKKANGQIAIAEAEMIKEAVIMALVPSHPNVVPLVGVCSSGKPLYIVASICEHGALHSFLSLRKAGPAGQQLTLTDKLTMAVQVASGMAHLHSMSLVHRDLACRNILVNALYVCQIADFGMSRQTSKKKKKKKKKKKRKEKRESESMETVTELQQRDRSAPPPLTMTSSQRQDSSSSGEDHFSASDDNHDGDGDGGEDDDDEYYQSARGQTFAIRWTAPESIQTNKFSAMSDVWSFGVVMQEIMRDGEKPYPHLINAVVISNVMVGRIDTCPAGCPAELFDGIMKWCWSFDAHLRPSFVELLTILEMLKSDQYSPSTLQIGVNASSAAAAAAVAAAAASSPATMGVMPAQADYNQPSESSTVADYATGQSGAGMVSFGSASSECDDGGSSGGVLNDPLNSSDYPLQTNHTSHTSAYSPVEPTNADRLSMHALLGVTAAPPPPPPTSSNHASASSSRQQPTAVHDMRMYSKTEPDYKTQGTAAEQANARRLQQQYESAAVKANCDHQGGEHEPVGDSSLTFSEFVERLKQKKNAAHASYPNATHPSTSAITTSGRAAANVTPATSAVEGDGGDDGGDGVGGSNGSASSNGGGYPRATVGGTAINGGGDDGGFPSSIEYGNRGAGRLDGAVANLAPNASNSEGGGGGGYTRATVGCRDGRESDGSKSTSNAADANGSLPVTRYAHLKARSATQAKAYEHLDTSLMAARTASTRATPTPASDPAVQQPPDTPQKKHTGYEYNDVVLALDDMDTWGNYGAGGGGGGGGGGASGSSGPRHGPPTLFLQSKEVSRPSSSASASSGAYDRVITTAQIAASSSSSSSNNSSNAGEKTTTSAYDRMAVSIGLDQLRNNNAGPASGSVSAIGSTDVAVSPTRTAAAAGRTTVVNPAYDTAGDLPQPDLMQQQHSGFYSTVPMVRRNTVEFPEHSMLAVGSDSTARAHTSQKELQHAKGIQEKDEDEEEEDVRVPVAIVTPEYGRLVVADASTVVAAPAANHVDAGPMLREISDV